MKIYCITFAILMFVLLCGLLLPLLLLISLLGINVANRIAKIALHLAETLYAARGLSDREFENLTNDLSKHL